MATDPSFFRAGVYTCTYSYGFEFGAGSPSPVLLGETTDGYHISHRYHNEIITVDRMGETPVDGIVRGRTTRVRFVLTNPTEAARKLIQYPFDSSTSTGTITNIGKTFQFCGGQLVLAPVASINSNNYTLTVPVAVPDEENGGFAFNNRSRQFECNLMAIANLSTGVEFTET